MQPQQVARTIFRYEKRVQIIYAFDVWSYHILTYMVYDPRIWNDLPPVEYDCPFWWLGGIGLILWTFMVLMMAADGLLSWKRTPGDVELLAWFFGCMVVHPVFFFLLARYSNQVPVFLIICAYRAWSFRSVALFLQEVRDKGQLLMLRRTYWNIR